MKKSYCVLLVLMLGWGLIASPGLMADCFQSQRDIDFTFQTLDMVLADLLPMWVDDAVWDDVAYQSSPYFGGVDNDDNGIHDDDQFDLLGAVYDGAESVVANLSSEDVTLIRNTFDANAAHAQTTEITLRNVRAEAKMLGTTFKIAEDITTGQPLHIKLKALGTTVYEDTFDIPSLWQGEDSLMNSAGPVLKDALLNLMGSYMTVGEPKSVEHLQSLLSVILLTVVRDLLPTMLSEVSGDITIETFTISGNGDIYAKVSGIPVVGSAEAWIDGAEIERTINDFANSFNCTDFAAAGGGCLTDLLGSTGDLNGDGQTNLASYNATTNRQGFMEAEGIVNPPLQILTQPVSQTVAAGDLVEMGIVYTGGQPEGAVEFKWETIDDDDFAPEAVVSTEPAYILPYAIPADTGQYTVTMCDSLWTRRSAPASLEVGSAAFEITAHPQSADLIVTEPLELSVTAHGGAAAATYQWQFDGGEGFADIPDATNRTFSIDALALTDAGSYRCLITGDDGAKGVVTLTSNAAAITVLDRIRFETPPADTGAYVGDPVLLSVQAVGAVVGTMHYQWKKDGADLPDSDAAEYAIPAATLEDSGVYSCTIYDDTFTIPSEEATLTIANHMAITLQPQAQLVYLGTAAELTVAVTGGLYDVHYQWYRGDAAVGEDSPTLSFTNLQPEDEATYYCEITDNRESLSSDSAFLTVVPPFSITQQPAGAIKYSGDTHTLSVAVEGGTPPFHYQWSKDGTDFGTDTASIEFASLQPSDSGSYTCYITDANGFNFTDPAVLDINDPMAIVTQPQSGIEYIGSPYTFTVEVSGGVGGLTYEWYKKQGSMELKVGQGSASYTIESASSITAGVYFCRIRDEYESIDSNIALLSVVEPLAFDVQPIDTYRLETGDCEFSIAVSGGLGEKSYQWFKDDVAIDGETTATLSMSNLVVEDSGEYRCEVTDDVKTSSSTVGVLDVALMLGKNGATLQVDLSSPQVVPPASSVITGTGTGYLMLTDTPNSFTLTIQLNHFVVGGTATRICYAPQGENGPVVFNMDSGTAPMTITQTLDNGQAAELLKNLYYIDVLTSSFPDGLIRGQILATRLPDNEGEEGEGEEGEGEEGEGEEGEGGLPPAHSADHDGDGKINISELLRVIQFFNSDGYQCSESGEDGFAPGRSTETQTCSAHSSDYAPQDWVISLSELLRSIQFFNSGDYHACEGSEDGFCVGVAAD